VPGAATQIAQCLTPYWSASSKPAGSPAVPAIASRGASWSSPTAKLLVAWDAGVAGSPNGVADPEAFSKVVTLRHGEEVATVLSLGYPAHPVDASRTSPEGWLAVADRKPLEDLVERIG
jgi:hypothetical protein